MAHQTWQQKKRKHEELRVPKRLKISSELYSRMGKGKCTCVDGAIYFGRSAVEVGISCKDRHRW